MITGNEPAFSKSAFYHPDGGLDSPNEGLTIRQHFAAVAMQAFITKYGCFQPNDVAAVVKMADELIDELNKQS